jgi:hypothetical protein
MVLTPSIALAAIVSRVRLRSFFGLHAITLIFLGYFQLPDVFSEAKTSVYNVLWVLVFGFATFNILGLAFRRFDTRKVGLTFGEIIAILVVVFSVILFGLEIVGLMHILPIHLSPR